LTREKRIAILVMDAVVENGDATRVLACCKKPTLGKTASGFLEPRPNISDPRATAGVIWM
jgi:hypothetical protein